jgi:hypothetical protein
MERELERAGMNRQPRDFGKPSLLQDEERREKLYTSCPLSSLKLEVMMLKTKGKAKTKDLREGCPIQF